MKNKLVYTFILSIYASVSHAATPHQHSHNNTLGASSMSTNEQITSQLELNKKTVLAFYEAGLNQKDFDTAKQYFGADYKQHNPNAADGIEGFHKFVNFLKENMPDSHSEIKQVFADGNFVILHVHKKISPTDRGVAIVDIFRLEQGKIVEHWDVTQAIPEKTASGNAMF